MAKIISLAKRRGFVFPSSEIYGGFGSSYDYGPLGVLMKNNIKKAWWDEMILRQDGMVGLDSAILMSPRVWEASGHLTAGFADELVECGKCRRRYRKDFVEGKKCPECSGLLSEPRKFNLMMKTFVGPLEDEASATYLRAETCQGIYLNFENVLNSMRLKLPFGIAQIGKAFRNEITPKDFIYRTREFEQMEMQWFCPPEKAPEFFDFWKEQRLRWYGSLGMRKENLRCTEVPASDRAHYARAQIDIEYKFPFGWKEIEGVHNRGDFDLSNHSKHSGKDLSYFDEEKKKKYFPYIIETSVGVERSLFAFLCDAYEEVAGGRSQTTKAVKEKEIVLRLNRFLSPVKAVVLPLVKNEKRITEKAREVYGALKNSFVIQYDEQGSVGRRYRRADEIGVPLALTVDFDSLEKDDVTVRDRDTMQQERISIKDLKEALKEKLGS